MLITNTSGNVVWANAGGDNLATANLTQTAGQDRTYDISSGNVFFSNGKVAIGPNTGTVDVDAALHVLGNGQIRAGSFKTANGLPNLPSYRFTNDSNTGMYLAGTGQLGFSAGGGDAIRITNTQMVGIGTTSPTSTLDTAGSFSSNIRTDTGATIVTIADDDYTVIVTAAGLVNLPAAAAGNQGRIYVIKNMRGSDITLGLPFVNLDGSNTTDTILLPGVTWLQSDGSTWHQIK